MDRFDVIVIGGGQAGLGMGYRLGQAGLDFVILDDHARTGDNWRDRWDSLELFTPRPFAQLPGLELPRTVPFYPTKDDVAAYLRRYREHFALPVRDGFTVTRLARDGGTFTVSSASETLVADQVVIATGPFHTPRVPEFADRLDAAVWQGHSSTYRNSAGVPGETVLVVGGGNSAAQIAEELAADHQVTIATGGRIGFAPKTIFGASLFRLMDLTGFLRADKDARFSRLARPYADTVIGRGLPRLVRRKVITQVPHRVNDCVGGEVVFADGSRQRYDSVLWATGFRPDYPWITVADALTDAGEPNQNRGVSPVPGLFWVGLPWQSRLNSALINGVAADTAELVARVVDREHAS
ncbi:flavin-containing monooxygenase [Actinokineospora sp.]|uniref:flavin-containing monooxygenase n=1 Tax=Actinokineospora sp. TaxID=1872133 RepID=UPI004037E527